MSLGGAGAAGGMADKEVQEFVMMEEQKAQFMMQKKNRKKLDDTLEIVVGTYEELSLGYRLDGEGQFQQTFTDHSHAGCVRAAAISSNGILATGSSDEMIRLFNLRKSKELGSLTHHEGSILWLEFHATSYMFSCSDDGSIGLWNTKTWECLKTFRGHRGAVHSCAFHPSGKLALSTGHDKTLRLWNLITGRSAYTTNLKLAADFVKWSSTGDQYLLVRNHVVQVYKTEDAAVEREIECTSKVQCLECTKDDKLLLGLEEGFIVVYDLSNGEKLNETKVHERRVKTMRLLESKDSYTLVTGSSDSRIKVWTVNEKFECELEAEVDTKFRITSMGAWFRRKCDAVAPKNVKTKTTEVLDEEEDSHVKEPEPKKGRVEIVVETEEPKIDKLAQRMMKKKGEKKAKQ